VLYWMKKGFVMRWQDSMHLEIAGLRFDMEIKEELLNQGFIRRDQRFLITPAGREAYESFRKRENSDE